MQLQIAGPNPQTYVFELKHLFPTKLKYQHPRVVTDMILQSQNPTVVVLKDVAVQNIMAFWDLLRNATVLVSAGITATLW